MKLNVIANDQAVISFDFGGIALEHAAALRLCAEKVYRMAAKSLVRLEDKAIEALPAIKEVVNPVLSAAKEDFADIKKFVDESAKILPSAKLHIYNDGEFSDVSKAVTKSFSDIEDVMKNAYTSSETLEDITKLPRLRTISRVSCH